MRLLAYTPIFSLQNVALRYAIWLPYCYFNYGSSDKVNMELYILSLKEVRLHWILRLSAHNPFVYIYTSLKCVRTYMCSINTVITY